MTELEKNRLKNLYHQMLDINPYTRVVFDATRHLVVLDSGLDDILVNMGVLFPDVVDEVHNERRRANLR